MTIRSSNQALQNQKLRRAQTLATCFELLRQDGFVLRFTDHDRPLTIDGDTFLPIGWGYVSAERRETGLRTGNQEASGPVDGDTITIPDLLGNRYRGATCYQSIVDWRRPWVWHYRATKRVRNVRFDGSSWVATLEGIGARLQRPVGGQRGGTHSTQCGYVLGGPFCGADLTDKVHLAPSVTGTSSGSNTGLTLNDTGAGWTPSAFAGFFVLLTGGHGQGQLREIADNDADTVTITSPWGVVPDNTSTFAIGPGIRVASVTQAGMVVTLNGSDFAGGYDDDFYRDGEAIWTTGDNAGHVSPIVGYREPSTAELTFLLPTPFPIDVNDRMILRPGCDGLPGTCKDKYDNILNYGGEPDTPGAGQTLEQPS